MLLFFRGEEGMRVIGVTGVQTCALPVSVLGRIGEFGQPVIKKKADTLLAEFARNLRSALAEIGRASCREIVESSAVASTGKNKTLQQHYIVISPSPRLYRWHQSRTPQTK